MVCVLVDALDVVIFRYLRVVCQEMQRLSVAEYSRDAVRVQILGVLEVLDRLLVLSQLSKKSGIVKTRPKVMLVHLEARLQVQDGFLVVFLLFADDSQVEESIDHVAARDVDSSLIQGAGLVQPARLLVYAAEPDQSFWVCAILIDRGLQEAFSKVEVLISTFTHQDLAKFTKAIWVTHPSIHSLSHLSQASLSAS